MLNLYFKSKTAAKCTVSLIAGWYWKLISFFAVLLVCLPSCLSQETEKWPFRSSSQAATCYYQSISILYLFNAEHQAGKLRIPAFKVFWSDSARESIPGLPNTRRNSVRCR